MPHRLLEADAFEDGVRPEAARELAYALDSLFAALADNVGRAELARQRDPVGVAAEHDDLLRAEAARGDHAAEADRAVADDRGDLAGPHRAATAAWWPVAMTSESVSSDGISASSWPTGSATSVPSACGTRTASPWPPSTRSAP